MSHTVKLREAAMLAAKLIERIVAGRTSTYDRLATMTGIDKSTLYYFAKGTRAESVKIEILAKIIDWVDRTNFQTEFFTSEQRELVEKLSVSLHSDKVSVAGWVSDGFVLSSDDKNSLLSELGGIHIGFRMRGTTDLVQVVGIEIYDGRNQSLLEWRMKFKEGIELAHNKTPIPEEQKRFREVRGFILKERNIATCIGRQPKSKELYVLNIMLSGESTLVHRAMYTTYSKHEAIARAMILTRRDDLAPPNDFEIDNIIGDYPRQTSEDSQILAALGLNPTESVDFGLSVNPINFKSLPKISI